MIYITGDTHGDFKRLNDFWLKAEDVLIICGDFGCIYANDKTEEKCLNTLSEKPFTIAFVDGNHENFPAIYSYPLEKWNGGMVHKIRKNIIHLMRGQVYSIDGNTFFVMGGAYSMDRYKRREGISWWSKELPSKEEYTEAIQTLNKSQMKVDFILSHTAPREIICRMGMLPDQHDLELTGFLEWIMHDVDFKKWFFGHWHLDKDVDERFVALWYDVKKIDHAGHILDKE